MTYVYLNWLWVCGGFVVGVQIVSGDVTIGVPRCPQFLLVRIFNFLKNLARPPTKQT